MAASHQGSAQSILRELKALVRPDKAEFLPGFFQAYPGGYGEGDRFLGVVVPDQRRVARHNRDTPTEVLAKLLASPWHECRLTALFILVLQWEAISRSKSFDDEKARHQARRTLVEFYLANLAGVNNWDLVDSSAHKILGAWVLTNPKEKRVLRRLVKSRNLWEQRIAVIATLPLIQAGQFDTILEFAERLLTHRHDLIHKAVGWMLREMGKVDGSVLRAFLSEHCQNMPRTMLRYAIEKLPDNERKRWLTI